MNTIRYLVMDVDGTLTDGKIYMGNNGEIFKAFDIKDGYGISFILPEHNIVPIVITARKSDIVLNRCKELGIEHCYQGCRNKKEFLCELMEKFGEQPVDGKYKNVAYIGDDVIDLPCMQICEYTGCPSDAIKEVADQVNYVCKKSGGNGAVREFIEWITKDNFG